MELEFKGTKGPWDIKDTEFGPVVKTVWKNDNDKYFKICMFPQNTDMSERIENAKLIAAAPDLFEALKLCVGMIEMSYGDCNSTKIGHSAINKALNGK